MPLYDFRCDKCGMVVEEFRRLDQPGEWPCPCGGNMAKMWTAKSSPKLAIWKPFVHEDLGATPVEITSKGQYKEELRRRGLICKAL